MNITVLLVEDDPDVSELYITRLKAARYTVIHVSHGEDVMPLVKDNKNRPDIILMDLMLPGMNGFDVVRGLRQTSWKEIPIVVLTAFADPTRQEEAKKLGLDSYYLKTEITPGELVKLIADQVASHRSIKH